jgi:hypothetical protein
MKNEKAHKVLKSQSHQNNPNPEIKKIQTKNLSPAKKFKLRLRRAKFQKQQQAKDDYFEHDNRDTARSSSAVSKEKEKKKKAGRLNKKGRRAQMYIDAYLKSQQMNQNGDTASQDETQDSSNGNEMAVKSIVKRATSIGYSSPITSAQITQVFSGKEQTMQKAQRILSNTNNSAKCCCHCACSKTKKKTRRKMSSPYFGDFNRTMSLTSGGSCTRDLTGVTTKFLNKTTTTTQETLVKASGADFINKFSFNKLPLKPPSIKINPPIFARKYILESQKDINGGEGDMRNFVRFVKDLFKIKTFR